VPQASSNAGVSLIEHHMAEGFAVPLHVHNDEDESFYILDGEFRFQVGEEVMTLTTGSRCMRQRACTHSFRVRVARGAVP
jgi:mannose-6-phosphate isomerase-like protein (cupin superfamily)